MLLRLLLLVALLVLVFAVVNIAERVRGRAQTLVPPGLTLVVGPGCRECIRARSKLDALDAVYSVLDVRDAERYGIASLAVPYAFVGSSAGELLMVRRGTSVASDAADLIAEAEPHGISIAS